VTSEMPWAQCIKRDVDVTVTEFQYVFECVCEWNIYEIMP